MSADSCPAGAISTIRAFVQAGTGWVAWEYVEALLNSYDELVAALQLAEVALDHSEPTMKHYGEPVERHEHAAKMVRAALSKAREA